LVLRQVLPLHRQEVVVEPLPHLQVVVEVLPPLQVSKPLNHQALVLLLVLLYIY
jgi:hypothetical protein